MRMQLQKHLKWAMSGIASVLIAAAGFYYVKTEVTAIPPVMKVITETLQNNVEADADLRAGLPLRLKIPSIKVDAAIEYVGIASDGNMDAPKGPDNVAWFEPGTRPG